VTVVLPLMLAAAGTVAGWSAFPLAQQEKRTSLPAGWRWSLAAATGAVCALLALLREPAELPAFALLAVLGMLLAAVDLRHKLLPNRMVLPFFGLALVLLVIAALAAPERQLLMAALLGSLAMFTFYLLAALAKPGGIGMGDVKLAAVVGLYAGYEGLTAWVAVLFGAFLLNAVAIILLMLARRLKRDSDIPFGPSMIAATLLVSLAGPLSA
jgi:leader peptidase (prepilin peptidase) / N-methyltransferase